MKINFTRDLYDIFQDAASEALRTGYTLIGVDHVMLALLRRKGSQACRLLRSMGIDCAEMKDYIDGNLQYIRDFVARELPKAKMSDPQGTYLAWIDFNGYVHGDAKKLEELMQKKAKVALDEGYIFGAAGNGFERINIAAPRSVIEDCMKRIQSALADL